MDELKYFLPVEFERCTPACRIEDMSKAFLFRLDAARELAGVAFTINSAYRSADYEKSCGRRGTSSHCKGVAVDIACYTDGIRQRILYGLIKSGFKRIGVAKRFIHVDADTDKPDAFWLY